MASGLLEVPAGLPQTEVVHGSKWWIERVATRLSFTRILEYLFNELRGRLESKLGSFVEVVATVFDGGVCWVLRRLLSREKVDLRSLEKLMVVCVCRYRVEGEWVRCMQIILDNLGTSVFTEPFTNSERTLSTAVSVQAAAGPGVSESDQ